MLLAARLLVPMAPHLRLYLIKMLAVIGSAKSQ